MWGETHISARLCNVTSPEADLTLKRGGKQSEDDDMGRGRYTAWEDCEWGRVWRSEVRCPHTAPVSSNDQSLCVG